ncbi:MULTISPECIES: R3H domain-containing nucleic acid-binding protein [Aphanizomenonaceae]|uniref:RNA-binding protein n=1 Tax=Dolichospermum heterosporum TAC447 TaxID=747523 RepID=A0ABY5LT83_9CYAN|nr:MULTISPECIES: R3H domain-containing nucleic acid-binding protein [Aphanizomenonaceae]MBE9257297.1 RNA-binding protein [Dolichospermum sp. LEGE 00246]MDK2409864.1 R3H domain-containing nucleic acid-binding protein [Aphanizomenon sp. 202]MDK2459903.1 R3H domain-containing nucleic acid-binding protein [Aphanizomenon sp. PH219]UUO15198.1 RNA-binding protein [Dolichospermum heterosporum TAC447]
MSDISMQSSEQWLQNLLLLTGVSTQVRANLEPKPSSGQDTPTGESYWLTIDQTNLTSEQIRILIGAGGSVLDSIQYLANSVLNLNQPEENQTAYTIELNGYRVRREAEIRTLAETAAAEVRFSGREVELQSLSSSERRQIHTLLQEFSDLETFSRGKEPHRHLVVRQAVTP